MFSDPKKTKTDYFMATTHQRIFSSYTIRERGKSKPSHFKYWKEEMFSVLPKK